MGELRAAIAAGAIWPIPLPELGSIVGGHRPRQDDPAQIPSVDLTGKPGCRTPPIATLARARASETGAGTELHS